MAVVYLVCGVPGAGKTWACLRAKGFNYVPHDQHYHDMIGALEAASKESDLPLLTECPFGERPLKVELEANGFEVRPVFVYEPADLIRNRYLAREKKEPTKAMQTRAKTIKNRIDEWGAPFGNSEEVLKWLNEQGGKSEA